MLCYMGLAAIQTSTGFPAIALVYSRRFTVVLPSSVVSFAWNVLICLYRLPEACSFSTPSAGARQRMRVTFAAARVIVSVVTRLYGGNVLESANCVDGRSCGQPRCQAAATTESSKSRISTQVDSLQTLYCLVCRVVSRC